MKICIICRTPNSFGNPDFMGIEGAFQCLECGAGWLKGDRGPRLIYWVEHEDPSPERILRDAVANEIRKIV